MRKLIVTVIAAVIAGVVLAPVPAQAGSSLCPASKVCLYDNINFSGLLGFRRARQGLMNISHVNNDRMSSWHNRTRYTAAWYYDADGKGTCRNMIPYTENPWVNRENNDKLTSWRTDRGC